MNSLVPPGSTLLEQRTAQVCSRIGSLNVPLRDLWNPDTCPAQFLPYLAWAFSVDRWDEKWSVDDKRKAVADAFYIHRKKGTVGALRKIVEGFGFSMSTEEWWQVADPAGTFRLQIDVNEVGVTEAVFAELERLISVTKPLSRHLNQLSVLARTSGDAGVASVSLSGDIITVYSPEYQPEVDILYNGIIHYDGNYNFG